MSEPATDREHLPGLFQHPASRDRGSCSSAPSPSASSPEDPRDSPAESCCYPASSFSPCPETTGSRRSSVTLHSLTDPTRTLSWTVGCSLTFEITEPVRLALQIAPAPSAGDISGEQLDVALDPGGAVSVFEVAGDHGSRIHVVDADTGILSLAYSATITRAVHPVARGCPGAPTDLAGGDRGDPAQPVLPLRRARRLRGHRVRRRGPRATGTRGVTRRCVGVRAARVRVRRERRPRHRNRHARGRERGLSRLRAPDHRALPRARCARTPRGRVRPGDLTHGLPRGRGGAHPARDGGCSTPPVSRPARP